MTEPPVVDLRRGPVGPAENLDYDRFYRRELPAMVALAAAITGSTVAAEDLAQEALIRAYRRWDEIGGYEKPGAWVRRVTVNLALSTRRRMGAEVRARLRLTRPTTLQPHPSEHDHVWAAVATLPGRQRAAVALHYLEDRSVADIAQILDCSESTARVHLHRGRTTLASLLEGAQS
jgi:RNA polymerase sigma-70 factor (ECF subfamily)